MDLNKIRSYLKEDECEIRLYKNYINILNYDSIGHFDSNKVIITISNDQLIINGQNLVVSRLLTDEVLITGNIKSIEFR